MEKMRAAVFQGKTPYEVLRNKVKGKMEDEKNALPSYFCLLPFHFSSTPCLLR
jgi:hypothetical protein